MKTYRIIATLCLAIALLAGVTAAIGAFGRGDGSTASATSIRGEQYEYVTTGVYAYNPERVVAEGVGWDYFTLFIAVPALLISLPWVARGSLRGRLVAMGVLGYLFYQYLMYAVFWAFGPLFPAFIVLYASSAAMLVAIVSTIEVPALSTVVSDGFPRRTMAIASTFMAFTLVLMWSQRIIAGLQGDWAATALDGMPAMSVQALDLGIIVPLALATSVFVWRRHAWGYLLGPVFAVKGVSMAGAICAMLISAAVVEDSLEVAPFALFFGATCAFGWLAWRMIASFKDEPAEVTARHTAQDLVAKPTT